MGSSWVHTAYNWINLNNRIVVNMVISILIAMVMVNMVISMFTAMVMIKQNFETVDRRKNHCGGFDVVKG